MLVLGDTVSKLKGCGPQTESRLRANGVATIEQLLSYKGPAIPGVDVSKLIVKAKAELAPTIRISAHNWNGRVAHVVSNHRPSRANRRGHHKRA